MFFIFLSHSWKKFYRSNSFGKDTAVNVFLLVMAVLIGGYLLVLGFSLNSIITKVLHQENTIHFLNGLLLYYFCFELLMRYFLQRMPALDAQPYLHLPIRKSTIAHYLLIRSLIHPLNVMVFLLFGPFALMVVGRAHGIGAGFLWLGALWMSGICCHYLMLLFKRKLDDTIWGLVMLLVVAALAGADYWGWYKLSDLSSLIFARSYLIVLATTLLLLALYYSVFRFFLDGLYPAEDKEGKGFGNYNVGFLPKLFGPMGDWIAVEVKLILRTKRARSFLVTSLLILLYGVGFYKGRQTNLRFAAFVGTFMTGAFLVSYGQLLFSWQSSHFDFVRTQPTTLKKYVASKYWLLVFSVLICFLLSIPYVYFGWKIILTHLAGCLFNIGVNSFVIMNMAMWAPQAININKGSIMNYEGIGAAQWVMTMPVLLGPYVFYLPFAVLISDLAGVMAVGLAGLLGFVFHKQLLGLTARRLEKRKYAIAEGFRN